MVQLSHLYTTTGKTTALTIWGFVDKVISLLFNTLSRFVTAFLPRTGNFMPAVTVCSDFGAQENKVYDCFPIYLPRSDGTRCYDLSFFQCWVLSQLFHSLSPSSRGSLVTLQFSSVDQSCPTLRPHGLQPTRLPCPSPTNGVYSNSCPLSQWCHPTISSSVIPFSFCLQSFPASGSFQMSQFFPSGGKKYWSFIFSISPSSEYSGLISFRILDFL